MLYKKYSALNVYELTYFILTVIFSKKSGKFNNHSCKKEETMRESNHKGLMYHSTTIPCFFCTVHKKLTLLVQFLC